MPQEKIGSIAWLKESQGRLTLGSRLALLRRVLTPNTAGIIETLLRLGKDERLHLEEVPLPDSPAVKHALDELESCASNSVIQHSFRNYLWSAGFGEIGKLTYDPEFLLIGCLLHDLGMTDRHRNGACHCFAGDSALAAAALMRKAGWAECQTESLADMICLHMNGHVTPSDGHEQGECVLVRKFK